MMALSLKQPFAWLIFCGLSGWKNIENRKWYTPHRGNLLIHAAKTMSDEEFEDARRFAIEAGLGQLPVQWLLKFGGIVGMVQVIGCVKRHSSPWFEGPWGWLLADPYPLPFVPYQGQRDLFEVQL